jgi:hypothetical protein
VPQDLFGEAEDQRNVVAGLRLCQGWAGEVGPVGKDVVGTTREEEEESVVLQEREVEVGFGCWVLMGLREVG